MDILILVTHGSNYVYLEQYFDFPLAAYQLSFSWNSCIIMKMQIKPKEAPPHLMSRSLQPTQKPARH